MDSTVTKLRASSGENLGTFTVGAHPRGIAAIKDHIWVTGYTDGTVTKLTRTGTVAGTFPVGRSPNHIAFDGANVWVTNSGDNTVSKLSQAGTLRGTYEVGTTPDGVAFDGENIWVANSGSHTVTKLSNPPSPRCDVAYGLLNLNTAPLATLSALPGMKKELLASLERSRRASPGSSGNAQASASELSPRDRVWWMPLDPFATPHWNNLSDFLKDEEIWAGRPLYDRS